LANPLEGVSIVCRMSLSTTKESDEGRIKRFSAVVVTDPDAAKKIVYGCGADAPRFSGKPCLTPSPGLSMLADLHTILCGGRSKDARPTGVSLLRPDGPLNVHSAISRHLYQLTADFCERLSGLTDARIHEVTDNWYQLLFPFLAPDNLPIRSKGQPQYTESTLCALRSLANVAIEQRQSLVLYVEARRAAK